MKNSIMTEHNLKYGTRNIPYNLHLVKRKRLRIVVTPELTVDVYAPDTANDHEIESALRKKTTWIAKKLDKMETYHPLPSPTLYVSGESFVYLGRQYRLKVEEGAEQPAKLLGRYLRVFVKNKNDTRSIKRAFDKWFRKRAQESFEKYLKKCRTITSRHGVPDPLLVIRKMKKRWGSCSQSGRITLNLKLVQAPVHCIEYVIMHELCHLKHHNHSKEFYSLLTRCLPDWRKRKETLDRIKLHSD
jgi:predicted metal-dependent hydrolase